MSPYLFLRNAPVRQGITGPLVKRANISVQVSSSMTKYRIEENSPVERNLAVGLHVTLAGAKVDTTYTQISGAAFNSAYILLKYRQTDIYEKISFESIRQANDFGRPYYINLEGPINLSESLIHVPDNSAIAANSVLEFQIDYAEPA